MNNLSKTPFEEVWKEIQYLEQSGNINALISTFVEHYSQLKPLSSELVETITKHLTQNVDFISHSSIKKLYTLSKETLRKTGLYNKIKSYNHSVPESKIGSIYFPIVTTTGHVYKIYVTDKELSTLTSFRQQLLDQVGCPTISALRQNLKLFFLWQPDRYYFSVLDFFNREDHGVKGHSMGLPLALSLFSHLTQRPLPSDLSATGNVLRNGIIKPVESIDDKLQSIKRERHFINRMMVSDSQQVKAKILGLDLVRVGNIREAFAKAFPSKIKLKCSPVEIDLEKEIINIGKQYQIGFFDTCIQNTQKLIEYLGPKPNSKTAPLLFTCYWRKGSCYCHKGNVKKAYICINKAHATYKRYPGVIEISNYFNSRINYAVLLKDVFRFTDAEKENYRIKKELDKKDVLDYIKGKNLSSLSQLYLARRDFEKAEEFQKQALKLIRTEDKHRNYGYLAQTYARKGNFQKAKRALNKKKDLLNKHSIKNHSYYHWIQAEYFYRKGLAMKRRHKTFFHNFHSLITHEYPEIDSYQVALVYKYSGLSLLEEGDEAEGTKRLEKAVTFLEEQINPMFLLLSASIRIEKALYFLKKGLVETPEFDIGITKQNLSVQKGIKKYFHREIKVLSHYKRFKYPKENEIKKVKHALISLREKIPY